MGYFKNFFLLVCVLLVPFFYVSSYAQSCTVTFAGRDRTNQYYVPLSKVVIFNFDQLWEEELVYPDTTLDLGPVGIDEYGEFPNVHILQNAPNPFDGTTEFVLVLPEDDDVILEIYDLFGKRVLYRRFVELRAGSHGFQVTLTAPQTYLLRAITGNEQTNIKMVNKGYGNECAIRYKGLVGDNFAVSQKSGRGAVGYPFSEGDEMRYIGYSVIDGIERVSETIDTILQNDNLFQFQFDVTTPEVSTLDALVSHSSAVVRGNVQSDNNSSVTQRGFCWSASPDPDLSDNFTTDVQETSFFSFTITQLMANTTYYVRAFATNAVGTSYGEEISFTTTPPVIPTVTTQIVSDISRYTAICGGSVTSDGGADVTSRGICWSTSQNPTVNDNHLDCGQGTGTFSCTMTGLTPMTTYYVRAYAINSVGISYGNLRSFTTSNYDGLPCDGAITVTDYDGNTYNTLRLGNQCWMKENLRTTHYSDGTEIALGTTSSLSSTVAYRYYPANSSSYLADYGYLYNWKAVMRTSSNSNTNPSGVQGVCPSGWHVPSKAEWMQLTSYLSGCEQYCCDNDSINIGKSMASNTTWVTSSNNCAIGNDVSSNNSSGFGAKPAGGFNNTGFFEFNFAAVLWSTTLTDSYVSVVHMYHAYAKVSIYQAHYYSLTQNAASVRCVRN